MKLSTFLSFFVLTVVFIVTVAGGRNLETGTIGHDDIQLFASTINITGIRDKKIEYEFKYTGDFFTEITAIRANEQQAPSWLRQNYGGNVELDSFGGIKRNYAKLKFISDENGKSYAYSIQIWGKPGPFSGTSSSTSNNRLGNKNNHGTGWRNNGW